MDGKSDDKSDKSDAESPYMRDLRRRVLRARAFQEGLNEQGLGDPLKVEHEIQRLMLERLGIEWTPGEPFYSLVEARLDALRAENERLKAPITNEWGQTLTPYNYLVVQLDVARAENERLRAILAGLSENTQCPWCLNLTLYPHGAHCEIAKALDLPREAL